MHRLSGRRSFTLIELLVVLAIVAILSTVVIMTLNPAELLKQARDSTRLSDLSTLNTALAAYSADVANGSMGTSSMVYVSVPDTSPICANLGLSALPAGWTYGCVNSTSTRLTNGTGWIPVNLSNISFGSPLSALPIDPINTTSSGNYYTYVSGGSFQLSSRFESQKYLPRAANSTDPSVYVTGNNTNLAPFVGGLAGYWKFDEASGPSTVDSSGYGRTGIFLPTTSTPSWVTGKVGGAVSIDNQYQRVQISNLTSISTGTTPGSISFWFYIRTHVNGAVIMGERSPGCYQDAIYENPGFIFSYYSVNGGSPDSIYIYPLNTWMHAVITSNGSGDWFAYSNGVEKLHLGSFRTDFSSLLSAIGGASCGAPAGMDGMIDDVRLYNRVLSASEVQALYNATK